MKKSVFAVLIGCLLASMSYAAGDNWMSDFEAAKEKAAKEGKDLFIDFTGSDWCGWCIRLDKEVFSDKAFMEEASKKFVFVVVDFPRNKPQDAALKKQNKELQAKYGIQGFPTIILANAKGETYGRTGYKKGGPEAYMKHLNELKGNAEKRDALVDKAAKAEGMDKAKLLGELIEVSKEMGATDGIPKYLDELAAVDKEDTLGLQYKYGVPQKIKSIQNDLRDIFMRIQELNKAMTSVTDKAQQTAILADLDSSYKQLEEIKAKFEKLHGTLHNH